MIDMQAECERILAEARQKDILLRVIGGMAIRVHSPQASELPSLKRSYGDLDFVTTHQDGQRMRAFFESIRFTPNARFNALQGKRRMIFNSPDQTWYIDIFIDDFRMCHNLSFTRERLQTDSVTIPLAELFLTKMQIIEINEKDLKDLAALLLEHPVGLADDETVNIGRVNEICSQDWGFYTTVRKNIDRIPKLLANINLPDDQKDLILRRTDEIAQKMDMAPKSTSWKIRSVIGERVRWYEEPEDAAREAIAMKLE